MNKSNHNDHAGIQILDHKDVRWGKYIESHHQANIFHHPAWMDLLSKCYGYSPFILAEIEDNGLVCSGLPFARVKSVFTGKRWVSLPFTDYCIPLYQDESSLLKLTNWCVKEFNEKKIPRIEVRWGLPDHEILQLDSEFVIHTIQLNHDSELVAKNFKRTHRQNIHTAEKRGVRIEWGDQIEQLRLYYQLQLETRHRQGLPVQPWKFFEHLGSSIFSKNLGFVLLAYKDEECIAGVVYLHWQEYMAAKYAASKDEYWEFRPNNLLFWKGIKWGCENGVSIFDFGRSEVSNSGLRRYKRGWGASEQSISYSILSNRPLQTGDSKIQNLMQPIFQKSPLWVCRVAGEMLYRHYG